MPVTYTLDDDRHEMYVAADGRITMDDIRKHLTLEHRDKGLAYRELIEASGATAGFSPSDVRATVRLLREYRQTGVLGPTAIVVGNELAYGMMRMLAIQLEGICELQPFRTRKEAEQWLAAASASARTSGPEGATSTAAAAKNAR